MASPLQVVLSPEQDPFYSANLFLNYGDLAVQVKSMMDQFQAKTKSSKDISSIQDMQVRHLPISPHLMAHLPEPSVNPIRPHVAKLRVDGDVHRVYRAELCRVVPRVP